MSNAISLDEEGGGGELLANGEEISPSRLRTEEVACLV